MIYGKTVRLAGMKGIVVTKQQCTHYIVSQGKQMLHYICKTWIFQNGRHKSYQSYWCDSPTCEQSVVEKLQLYCKANTLFTLTNSMDWKCGKHSLGNTIEGTQ